MAIYRGTGGSTSTTEQATIDAVNEDAATATTKAAEASASATAAATSASSASSSATSASSSASTATTKANEASTSATNAATSASAASSSASAASTSASNAASSATTATTQASSATTSAANAAASETAAETAESNAQDFASDAQKSAYGAEDVLQTLSDSSTLYSARHYAAKASADSATATTKASEAASSASAASSSASAAQAAEDAALAALDSFDDRYLGQKTSDPTTDNDGDALVAGALYYNTTDDIMKVYDGSIWVAAYASLSGTLVAANNLSDLASASAARTNLGLGTAATTASTDYATAAQGALADSALQSSDIGVSVQGYDATIVVDADIGSTVQAYSSVLANTTASYTTAEETKLAGIESGATADQTAQEIATAIDADATAEATLKSALGLGTAAYTASTAYVATTGDSMTGSLSFGDNDRARFGNSFDLQIYHSGSSSFITDSGTGSLYIQGSSLYLEDSSGNNYIDCTDTGTGGTVRLRHNTTEVLRTAATGIEVTGTVNATSFTGDGSSLTGISSDLVDDTTPQLGGDLDTNGNAIDFGASGWSIALSGTDLVFSYGGVAKIKFASNGEIVTVDDVTAFGTV